VFSPQRLLLHALLNGLGEAVRRNDGLTADRYYRRVRMMGRHFETNPALSNALERLLLASDQWLAKPAERYAVGQQVLELIESVLDLL
jgi:hypothetical protein